METGSWFYLSDPKGTRSGRIHQGGDAEEDGKVATHLPYYSWRCRAIAAIERNAPKSGTKLGSNEANNHGTGRPEKHTNNVHSYDSRPVRISPRNPRIEEG